LLRGDQYHTFGYSLVKQLYIKWEDIVKGPIRIYGGNDMQ